MRHLNLSSPKVAERQILADLETRLGRLEEDMVVLRKAVMEQPTLHGLHRDMHERVNRVLNDFPETRRLLLALDAE